MGQGVAREDREREKIAENEAFQYIDFQRIEIKPKIQNGRQKTEKMFGIWVGVGVGGLHS